MQHGGGRLHAGGVGLLPKQGLALFEQVRYLEGESDIDVKGVVALFEALGLQAGLVRDKDERTEAVKELRLRGQASKNELSNLRQGVGTILSEALQYPDVPWGQLDGLRKSAQYVGLNQLKGLPFISASEFNQIALELQSLEHRRCTRFGAEVLETFVTCPYCGFPQEGAGVADLTERLAELDRRLGDLWVRWQEQLLSELPGLPERLDLLPPERRDLVQALLDTATLPSDVSDDLLAALHELSSDLQPVDLDLAALAQALLERGSALTVDDLRNGLEAYLASLLKGYDQDLVRIEIVIGAE